MRATQQRKHCSQPWQSLLTPSWKQPKRREGFYTGANCFPCFTFYDKKHGEGTAPISIHSIPVSLCHLENLFNLSALTSTVAQRSQGAQVVSSSSHQEPASLLVLEGGRTHQSDHLTFWIYGYHVASSFQAYPPLLSRYWLQSRKRRIEPSWSTDNICSNHEDLEHQKQVLEGCIVFKDGSTVQNWATTFSQ